jgi:hypothetical protein
MLCVRSFVRPLKMGRFIFRSAKMLIIDDGSKLTKKEEYLRSLEDENVNKMNAGLGMTFKCNKCGELHRNSDTRKVDRCFFDAFSEAKKELAAKVSGVQFDTQYEDYETKKIKIVSSVHVKFDRLIEKVLDAHDEYHSCEKIVKDALKSIASYNDTVTVSARQVLASINPIRVLTSAMSGITDAMGDINALVDGMRATAKDKAYAAIAKKSQEFNAAEQELYIDPKDRYNNTLGCDILLGHVLGNFFVVEYGSDGKDMSYPLKYAHAILSVDFNRKTGLTVIIALSGYILKCAYGKTPIILQAPHPDVIPKELEITEERLKSITWK